MGLLKKLCKHRKAISTPNAAIIVAAVAIFVSVMVAVWIMLPGGPAGVEALAVARGSGITAATNSFTLILQNTGTGDASVTLIKVGGEAVTSTNPAYPVLVRAGDTVTVTGGVAVQCVHGADYEVLIYTAAGHAYPTRLFVS